MENIAAILLNISILVVGICLPIRWALGSKRAS